MRLTHDGAAIAGRARHLSRRGAAARRLCRRDRISSGRAASCSRGRSADGRRFATGWHASGPGRTTRCHQRRARRERPHRRVARPRIVGEGRMSVSTPDGDCRALVSAAAAPIGAPARPLRGDVVHDRAPGSADLRRRRTDRHAKPFRDSTATSACRHRRRDRRRSAPTSPRASVTSCCSPCRRSRRRSDTAPSPRASSRRSSAATATRCTCGSTSACARAPSDGHCAISAGRSPDRSRRDAGRARRDDDARRRRRRRRRQSERHDGRPHRAPAHVRSTTADIRPCRS